MTRATTRIALAVIAGALLAACSSPGASQEPPAAGPDTGSLAVQQQTLAAPLDGYKVSVPKLGLTDAALVPLDLNADHTIQVPPLSAPQELGVYDKGPKPGQNGPSIILGHVNSGGVDGAFAHLSDLQTGDEVDTIGPAGPVRFRVYKAEVIEKGAFPTRETYSDTAGPELRLITCGPGPLDSTGHNYLDQTIVWAKKI